jgi:hypothetical protein
MAQRVFTCAPERQIRAQRLHRHAAQITDAGRDGGIRVKKRNEGCDVAHIGVHRVRAKAALLTQVTAPQGQRIKGWRARIELSTFNGHGIVCFIAPEAPESRFKHRVTAGI